MAYEIKAEFKLRLSRQSEFPKLYDTRHPPTPPHSRQHSSFTPGTPSASATLFCEASSFQAFALAGAPARNAFLSTNPSSPQPSLPSTSCLTAPAVALAPVLSRPVPEFSLGTVPQPDHVL